MKNKIKTAREKKKLTQEQLAERANIGGGQPRIAEYEAGVRVPTVETLRKLSRILGVSWHKLAE